MTQLELQQKHVAQVLEQLTTDYQAAKAERNALASKNLDTEGEGFTLLEELELLTVDIRGFGCQFLNPMDAKDRQKAVDQLKLLKVFDIAVVKDFYFDSALTFDRLKLYISLLDYLRLLMLQYLQAESATEVAAA